MAQGHTSKPYQFKSHFQNNTFRIVLRAQNDL